MEPDRCAAPWRIGRVSVRKLEMGERIVSESQISSVNEVDEFPFWMRLADEPWCGEVNDPPQEFILVEGRSVSVARSFVRGVHVVDLTFWGRVVNRMGMFAIPFIAVGWAREKRITLQIHHLGPITAIRPDFVVRVDGRVILRTTFFDLAREQIRFEITKR